LGDGPLTLRGAFRLDDSWCFAGGTVTGEVAGGPVSVRAEALDGGISTSGTLRVDGTIAGAALSVFATVARTRAIIRGHLDGHPIELDVNGDPAAGTATLRGRYGGPPAVLAVVIGAVLHFV
jgi:hypothetical protein